MKVMLDANVVIDYATNREPFADAAQEILLLCAKGKVDGVISAGEATTIYYILRKSLGADHALTALRTITKYVDVADVNKVDVLRAFDAGMPDYEDAVLAQSAKRAKAAFIVTRDAKDFGNSPIPSISLTDFLKQNVNP